MLSPWTRNAEDFSKFQRQEKMSFMNDKRGETNISIFRFRFARKDHSKET